MKQSFKQKYAIFLKTSSRVSRLLWGVQTWMLDQIVRQDVGLLMHRSVFEKKKSLGEGEGVNITAPKSRFFCFLKKLSDEVSQNLKWSPYYCRGFNSGENSVFRMFLRCLEIKFLYEGVSPKNRPNVCLQLRKLNHS